MTIQKTAMLIAVAISATTANAGLVTNGSFESTTATVTSSFQSVVVTGWANSTLGQIIVLPSWYTSGYLFPLNLPSPVGLAGAFPQSSPDGGNFAMSDADFLNSPITQTITGLNPGSSYLLTFFQSLAQDTEAGVTIPGPVSAHWDVSLGATTQSSSGMAADGSIPTFAPWKQESMAFIAQSATEVLSFLSVGSGDPPLIGLDGVSLVETPEPDAIWLMVLGGALCGWKLRRSRKAA